VRDKQKDAVSMVTDIGNIDNLVGFDDKPTETFDCFYDAFASPRASTRLWQDRITKLKTQEGEREIMGIESARIHNCQMSASVVNGLQRIIDRLNPIYTPDWLLKELDDLWDKAQCINAEFERIKEEGGA
jgi:hypothetical protein